MALVSVASAPVRCRTLDLCVGVCLQQQRWRWRENGREGETGERERGKETILRDKDRAVKMEGQIKADLFSSHGTQNKNGILCDVPPSVPSICLF